MNNFQKLKERILIMISWHQDDDVHGPYQMYSTETFDTLRHAIYVAQTVDEIRDALLKNEDLYSETGVLVMLETADPGDQL